MREYKKTTDKFLARPKPPHYKKKNGEHLLIFTPQQVKITDGCLKFPKMCNFEPIKTRLSDDTKLKEVRIIPRGTGYNCEIVYEKEVIDDPKDVNRIIGIDYGINNIVTIANNIRVQPIVIKGGAIKSINQFYNKERAELQSTYAHQNIKLGS